MGRSIATRADTISSNGSGNTCGSRKFTRCLPGHCRAGRHPRRRFLPAFRSLAREGKVLYYPFDTHWNPLGRRTAAEILAASLHEVRDESGASCLRARLVSAQCLRSVNAGEIHDAPNKAHHVWNAGRRSVQDVQHGGPARRLKMIISTRAARSKDPRSVLFLSVSLRGRSD